MYSSLEMTANPRPYHHGNLRAELLDAAEKALESEGVKSISLRELARELGVSHTSPRRHFADKQALLDALALSGFERFEAALGRATQNRAHSFKTRLIKLCQAYVTFALKHPALLALMFETKHRVGAPREILQTSTQAFDHAHATFAAGQANGEVIPGDPARLSLVAIATVQGLITISTNGKFKGIDLLTLTEEIIDRIITGLRPRK